MTPIEFDGYNIVFGANQLEYQPLPAHVEVDNLQGTVTTCWQLTHEELVLLIANGGRIWLQQMSFGQALQPQLPSVERPIP